MTDLTVAPNEHGVLRLFKLNMRPEEARFLREPGAAAQILGVEDLNPDQIDVFPVSDLDDLGLYGYLSDGCGVPEDQLDRTALEAIEGWVLLLRSAALGGRGAELKPDARVQLIGLYTEEATSWTGGVIETESAKPYSSRHQSPRVERARAQRMGSAIFAAVMIAVFGGLLWLIF